MLFCLPKKTQPFCLNLNHKVWREGKGTSGRWTKAHVQLQPQPHYSLNLFLFFLSSPFLTSSSAPYPTSHGPRHPPPSRRAPPSLSLSHVHCKENTSRIIKNPQLPSLYLRTRIDKPLLPFLLLHLNYARSIQLTHLGKIHRPHRVKDSNPSRFFFYSNELFLLSCKSYIRMYGMAFPWGFALGTEMKFYLWSSDLRRFCNRVIEFWL